MKMQRHENNKKIIKRIKNGKNKWKEEQSGRNPFT